MFVPNYTPPPKPSYDYVVQIVERDMFMPVQQLSSTGEYADKKIINEFIRYQVINDSFLSHGGKGATQSVKETFDSIAQIFRTVAFKRVVAEYSQVMEMIQFSMYFSNGMRVSFGKPVDEKDSDEVCFSLTVDNEVLLVDRKRVEDLKDVLLETVQD